MYMCVKIFFLTRMLGFVLDEESLETFNPRKTFVIGIKMSIKAFNKVKVNEVDFLSIFFSKRGEVNA